MAERLQPYEDGNPFTINNTGITEELPTTDKLPAYKDSAEQFIGILPATSEQAKKGAQDFGRAMTFLPLELRPIFLESVPLQTCFVGITAEEGGESGSVLDDITSREREQINHSFSLYTPHMRILEFPERDAIALVNIQAATRIMHNYPNEFSDVPHNGIYAMLKDYPEMWRPPENETRYGLLSGFPLSSVLKFQEYTALLSKLGQSYWQFSRYRKTPTEMRTDKMLQDLIITFTNAGIDYSEQSLLLNSTNILYARGYQGYIGFSLREDQQYVQQLNYLFDQSGIDDIVSDLTS